MLAGAALSLIAGATARAQELRFRQLTPDAGLSSSYVQSIFQDRTGFLWFGTDKGLDRYDGYVIHSYRHRRTDPKSIADGTIHVLHADRGDTMWVGTNAGLSRYDADHDAFINYSIGSGTHAVHGIADEAGAGSGSPRTMGCIASTARTVRPTVRRRCREQPSRRGDPRPAHRSSRTTLDRHADARSRRPRSVERHDAPVRRSAQDPRSLPDDDVRSIVEDAGGSLWIGTWNGGLARLNPESGRDHDATSTTPRIRAASARTAS